jgi:MYXO-CTERM domain-containing protein
MKDGDFDRLRIPMGNGSDSPGVLAADPDDDDDADEAEFEERLGVAATPAQLAAGSAIIAGLILVGLAALRRRRSGGRPNANESR